MEPISTAASCLALFEAAVVVSKAATHVYRNVRDAPKELAHLSNRILQTQLRLNVQLQFYQSLGSYDVHPLLSAEALQVLQADLDDAQASLGAIEEISLGVGKRNASQRVSWALYEKRKVTKILEKLRDIDSNLCAMLATLSVAVGLRSNMLIERVGRNQKFLVSRCRSCSTAAPTAIAASSPQTAPRTTTASSNIHAEAIEPWEVRTAWSTRHWNDDFRSLTWVIGLLRLPSFLSHYALCATTQIYFSRLNWPCARCTLSLKTILPFDSSFLDACALGDVGSVKHLALNGHGTPSSMDEAGRPVLHYAVASGSYELVKFLLDNGATPDDLDNHGQVSPLQEACTKGFLEIARLLLAKGAFLEHTDACDRTAFTMLWFMPSFSFSRVEFLQTFLAYSPLPIAFGKLETSPLVSAAINGSVDDLSFLIASSASLTGFDFVGERLIQYSIFGYNTATYDYLEPLMPRGWTSEVDDLGKGPLHRALSFPCSYMKDMVGRLVRTGVDVHSRTVDGSSLWEFAKTCDKSAESLGRSEPGSSKSSRAYLDALLSKGLDVEVDSEGDLWWPSEERAEVLPNIPHSSEGL